jgi:hypothetical protein
VPYASNRHMGARLVGAGVKILHNVLKNVQMHGV